MIWEKAARFIESKKELALIISTISGGGVLYPVYKFMDNSSHLRSLDICMALGLLFISYAGTKLYSLASIIKEIRTKNTITFNQDKESIHFL